MGYLPCQLVGSPQQTLICHDFFMGPWDDGGTQAASAWLNGFSFVTPQAGGEKMEMEIRVLLLLLENL